MATDKLLIIAHRGASADYPEHTLAAYELAIKQGADFIEPDLVPTKDGHLIARHENEIGGTTNVADFPEFANRRTTKLIDSYSVTGWFTEDFTLAEIKQLRTKERLPDIRPQNRRFDLKDEVPTFDEILALVKRAEAETGRKIGIYPETKHPSYFRRIGLPLEDALVQTLHEAGYKSRQDPVFIQSFEYENLKILRSKTNLPLIQLMEADGAPADRLDLPYARLASAQGLIELAKYADGIGVEKSMIFTATDKDGKSGLVEAAKAAGLDVHVWTFRPENYFLPEEDKVGTDPNAYGNMQQEIRRFKAAGIDGIFVEKIAKY